MSDEQKNPDIDIENPDELATAEDEAAANVAEQFQGQDLVAEVERLNEELMQTKEQALRAHAEAQNAMRRAQQDVEKAHKFGQEKLITDLVTVVDNLERALTAAQGGDAGVQAIAEGVELTLKSLLDTLQKHQVEVINPVSEPFNPQLHQAMTAIENGDVEPNTVIDVFQKGYTLHGRLVRPAMVVVSKAPVTG